MKNDNEVLDYLRNDIDNIEVYTPDDHVWSAINSELNKPKRKSSHNILLAIAASMFVFMATPILYNQFNHSKYTEINELVQQSQILEQKISNIRFNNQISASLQWKLHETEIKLNTVESNQERVSVWQERVNLLNDVVAASKHQVEFI